jgi:transcriptional regulator
VTEALVVFQGPEAYITPSWYAVKAETGKVVPTWNYAVVQVHGRLRVIEDQDWLRVQIEALTRSQEDQRERGWQVSDAPASYVEAQIKGIVGIEIAITRIEGKWKVSQNRPERDRTGVVAGLREGGDEARQAMADLVATPRKVVP